ncbi:MAG: alpha/beta hydrolase-fold protein [Isosphaeraceae bacterium]
MMNRLLSRWSASLIATLMLGGAVAAAQPTFKDSPKVEPTARERADLRARINDLDALISKLKTHEEQNDPRTGEPLADVTVYLKAAQWIDRHGEFFNKNYLPMTLKALERGRERAEQLASKNHPWTEAKGSTIRGYLSKVDDSIQPYAIIVPESYPGEVDQRWRLDVVLHGRGSTLNEVSFINAHDGKPALDDQAGLVLHVFGRTNNAYRWAGESDVFEAIAAVKRNFNVDERRIVLRGFSMGGAGAWHLGLHHPSLWCSVEAGAGFSDSKKYLKLGALPPYQEKGLHIYDAVDYALNAFNVPMAGYGGEDDPQQQASLNIKDALEGLGVQMVRDGLVTRAEGIDFLQIVGAKMGHKIDPESAKLLKAFHDEHADKGLDTIPGRIRFVTYTLKYNRAPWFSVEQLREHYTKATVDAEVEDGTVHVRAQNVAVLAIDRDAGETVRFADQAFPLRLGVKGLLSQVYFRQIDDGWEMLDYDQSRAFQENIILEKRHDLQGPIDDAFNAPFLCVRGTGTPWNPAVQTWADARLDEFAKVWSKSLRGDLPIKDDVAVTERDLETHHLVLFGDPGSNKLIAKVLAKLPMGWTKDQVRLAGEFSASDHAPALIAPNPLNRYHYVVINSGHTFGADAFAGSNAQLYPRLGDYAVFQIGATKDDLKTSGFFDESWKQPLGDRR